MRPLRREKTGREEAGIELLISLGTRLHPAGGSLELRFARNNATPGVVAAPRRAE
jgi:hypothetical protein